MRIPAPSFALSFFFAVCVSTAVLRGAANEQQSSAGPGAPPQPPTETPNQPAPGAAPKGFWERDSLTANWGGLRDTLNNDGFNLTPTYTGEVFGNPSGGARQGVISDGLFNVAADFDLDKMTGGEVRDLAIHANALYIYGNNLSAQDVGDFSTTSNIAAYNTLRLQELWIQQSLWNKKFSIKVGNIAVDNEFFQSPSSALFIGATFGQFTLLANNIPNTPAYPLASPGVRLNFQPNPAFYVMAGVFGLDNSGTQEVNNHGTRFALNGDSGMFIISEAGYLLNQGPNDKGLQGTYRIGSFLDTGDFDDFGSEASFANGTGPLQSAGADYAIYGVIDQQLFAQDKKLITFFVRSGGAPSNASFVDYYVDSGFNFTGFVPGRATDIAGIAVARSHVSSDYSDSQVLQGGRPSTAETVIEGTYKIQLAPWWGLQPDVQYILTPSGVQGSRNALVLGLRTTVAF